MKSVGLFEAKTKFSEICRGVAATGKPVEVTQRGKAVVRIEAVKPRGKSDSVWERRAAYVKKHGRLTDDFELPKAGKQTWRDPLE